MKRRQFMKKAGLAGITGAAALNLSAPAIAANKRQLKMVTAWPKNYPGLGVGAERFAKRVTEMSDGDLTVKVFGAGELVPALECFDAVSNGTADFYHATEYYWQGKSPAYAFMTSVPFGMTAAEVNAWVYYGGAQQIWDDLSAEFNIKPFLIGNTGAQMGGWFNKEIQTTDDLNGLKIRMPGLGGAALSKLGATTVNLPGGEITQALQRGTIDATEWVGPWNDMAFGLHKVAKFYYYPGFHEPSGTVSMGINLKVWEDLSTSHKAIIEQASIAENNLSLAEFNMRNLDALNVLQDKEQVQFRTYSDDLLKDIARASSEVVKEYGETDETTKKMYDSFMEFRRKSIDWAKYSEKAFAHARQISLAE